MMTSRTLRRLATRTVAGVLLTFGLVIVGPASPAHAKVFRNAYVSFELPEKWECVLEQTEFVCKNQNTAVDREAIIILTAKEVGPADNLGAYEQHLKTARVIASRSGQPLQSQVLKVVQRNIAMQPWVDGMHLASEVPNYYTRYLATTRDRIGILVTFSAHKLHYTKYSAEFFRAIESLRVTASKSILSGSGGGANLPGSELIGANNSSAFAGEGEMMPEEGSGSGGGGTATKILGLALLLGAAGAVLLLKRRKKRK